MPLPKFLQRKTAAPEVAPHSDDSPEVQEARTRARRRLMGAVVLLAAGVLVFPLLFETQPRPAAGEVAVVAVTAEAVRKPAAAGVVPSVTNAANVTGMASAAPSAPLAPKASASNAAPAASSLVAEAPVEAKTAPAVPPALPDETRDKPTGLTNAPIAAASTPKPSPAPEAPPTAGRFVVQVGAFTDMVAVREARQKVEKLGLKTYIQAVDSPTGKRTRVRVGPFEKRDEAERAAVKLKAADLPAFILAL